MKHAPDSDVAVGCPSASRITYVGSKHFGRRPSVSRITYGVATVGSKHFEPTYVIHDADGQPTATREINLYSEYFLETPISRSPYVNYIVVGVE